MKYAAVLTVIVAGVLAVAAGGTKTASSEVPRPPEKIFTVELQKEKKADKLHDCNKWKIVKGIRFYRSSTWTWNWMLGTNLARFSKWSPKHSCAFLHWLAISARKKSQKARKEFQAWFVYALAKWDCIHRHEASWYGDNNPTYDGGLQMDDSFESSYGSDFIRLWGHDASDWPVWAQLRAAERAFASRGFGPWPTRKYCGL